VEYMAGFLVDDSLNCEDLEETLVPLIQARLAPANNTTRAIQHGTRGLRATQDATGVDEAEAKGLLRKLINLNSGEDGDDGWETRETKARGNGV
jgi:hypothetical protein